MTETPTIRLAEYVALVAGLPPPTEQQKENFAHFVSSAHSWYKHIPFWQPGVPFHFFIDPSAGCERRVTIFGKVKFRPRLKQGFHYSWIQTTEYRERFGYLAYSCGAGTKAFHVRFGFLITPGDNIEGIPKDGRLYRLPQEVVEAGSVQLTSVIHDCSATISYWDKSIGPESLSWPAESGGRETLQKIIKRCKAMRHESLNEIQKNRVRIDEVGFVDAELFELLRPERQRQQSEMLKAMKRVCDLVCS
jgi:hypothetical protein